MKTMTKTIAIQPARTRTERGHCFCTGSGCSGNDGARRRKAGAWRPAPAATVAKPAAKVAGVPKTATTPEGVECSKQADAKNLHGKERVKFRAKCKSDLKKAAKAAGAARRAAPAAMPAKKAN